MIHGGIGAVLAAVFAMSAVSSAITGPEILRRNRETYAQITTFKADVVIKDSAQTMQGTLFRKAPTSFRMEVGPQLVVSDGQTTWIYMSESKQVIINTYNPDAKEMRQGDMLFELPEMEQARYVGDETVDGVACYVVDVPYGVRDQQMQTARVWVNQSTWAMVRMQYGSPDRSGAMFTLKNIQINPSLPDSTFAFSPPPDARVLDLRAGIGSGMQKFLEDMQQKDEEEEGPEEESE